MEAKRHYLVICEGASEYAYVQELNRFLNEDGLPLIFTPVDAHGGGIAELRRLCRRNRLKPQSNALILADRDLYFDESSVNGRRYARWKSLLPRFCFQYFNFEDFLLMHFPSDVVTAWKERVAEAGHFRKPLKAAEYDPIFMAFVKEYAAALCFGDGYRKGCLPFVLTRQKLENLWCNNSPDGLPRSDFASFLRQELEL